MFQIFFQILTSVNGIEISHKSCSFQISAFVRFFHLSRRSDSKYQATTLTSIFQYEKLVKKSYYQALRSELTKVCMFYLKFFHSVIYYHQYGDIFDNILEKSRIFSQKFACNAWISGHFKNLKGICIYFSALDPSPKWTSFSGGSIVDLLISSIVETFPIELTSTDNLVLVVSRYE